LGAKRGRLSAPCILGTIPGAQSFFWSVATEMAAWRSGTANAYIGVDFAT